MVTVRYGAAESGSPSARMSLRPPPLIYRRRGQGGGGSAASGGDQGKAGKGRSISVQADASSCAMSVITGGDRKNSAATMDSNARPPRYAVRRTRVDDNRSRQERRAGCMALSPARRRKNAAVVRPSVL